MWEQNKEGSKSNKKRIFTFSCGHRHQNSICRGTSDVVGLESRIKLLFALFLSFPSRDSWVKRLGSTPLTLILIYFPFILIRIHAAFSFISYFYYYSLHTAQEGIKIIKELKKKAFCSNKALTMRLNTKGRRWKLKMKARKFLSTKKVWIDETSSCCLEVWVKTLCAVYFLFEEI